MNLADFATLALAQEHTVTVDTKQVGSGQARGLFISEMGAGDYSGSTIWAIFSAAAADINNPLFSLASAILITASDSGSYFGMDETKAEGIANRAGIVSLVAAGIMTQETADKFIAKTLSITYPFANATAQQFNQAKGVYTEKLVENYTGQDIKLTFIAGEDCTATTWVKSEFNDENFGKIGHVKTTNSLTKITTNNKKCSGDLYVRLPIENATFTVETI